MRKNTRKKYPEVTARDLKILVFVLESKIVSRNQLQNEFFSHTKTVRSLNARLNRLVLLSLLSRAGIQTEKEFLFCYSITKEGLFIVQEHLIYKPLKLPERSEKPIHDLTLVDIRRFISKRKCVLNYLTENVLQCLDICAEYYNLGAFVKSNMDAAIELEINQKRFWVALEFENTCQSFEKTDKKLKKFYDSEIAAMFLVCRTKTQLEQIQAVESDILKSRNCKSRIYGISLDVLLATTTSINFTSQSGLTVRLP
ncbi:MAG: hypothetical protein H6623_01675 [Bdellovibrionaceae bacterium]|nr:hypothetical protein [Pseudobdellovibrionaceae bacterium]